MTRLIFYFTRIPSLFDDNLREVDRGVSNVYALFDGLFPDERTAYIFTADHGMTNKGKNNFVTFFFVDLLMFG